MVSVNKYVIVNEYLLLEYNEIFDSFELAKVFLKTQPYSKDGLFIIPYGDIK